MRDRSDEDQEEDHDSSQVMPYPSSQFEEVPHRSVDLVSMFRQSNSVHNNIVNFVYPKVVPMPIEDHPEPMDADKQPDQDEEKSSEMNVALNPAEREVFTAKKPAPMTKLASQHRFKGLSIISAVSVKTTTKGKTSRLETAIDHWLWDLTYKAWSEGYLKALLLWVVWMTVGTLFYAVRNKMGFAKGFYMAVNVGYSIGSNYPREIDNVSLWFSVFNILVGVVAIGFALNAFAQDVINFDKRWFNDAEYSRLLGDKSISKKQKLSLWIQMNKSKLYVIAIFIIYGSFMVCWASFEFEDWKFPQALYFATSSLSTGGMYPMPKVTSQYNYVIVGLFISFGVPLMCLAMGNIAALLLKFGDPEEDKKIIRGVITREEVEMMKEFGIDDGDGVIDRADFILLCAVRLGAATPELIEEINKRFATLDAGRRGALTREEILQVKIKSRLLVNNTRKRANSEDY